MHGDSIFETEEIDHGASMPGNLADVNMHIGCYTKLAIIVPIYAITVLEYSAVFRLFQFTTRLLQWENVLGKRYTANMLK
jgi:hypothetical protein